MTEIGGRHTASPRELKARLEAERAGEPFLIYRDGDGAQVIFTLNPGAARITIGRRPENDVALDWDAEISRVHAQLEPVGRDWALIDDGLSRNGSYVNGEQIHGRRRLRDGDRLCFGETPLLFCAPEREHSLTTAAVKTGRGDLPLSDVERRVLIGLCRPLRDTAYATPATNREIADEVHLSVDAVKAHLRVLFDRFDLGDLPQNQKRARLAALALVNGFVKQHDF
jgi:pSer/pThr/pTyr-binding forkhead associated (FHA) protein